MSAPALAYECCECGRAGDAHFYVNAADLRTRGVCFTCGYWQDLAAEASLPTSVRIAGIHYQVGPGTSQPRGFGGQRFEIRFSDGREVITTDLWHQGQIPARFRARLPDNAVFVRAHATRGGEVRA